MLWCLIFCRFYEASRYTAYDGAPSLAIAHSSSTLPQEKQELEKSISGVLNFQKTNYLVRKLVKIRTERELAE